MTETGAGAKYDKLSLLLLTVLFLPSKFPSRPLIQVTKLVFSAWIFKEEHEAHT